jgi:hypothetical protein
MFVIFNFIWNRLKTLVVMCLIYKVNVCIRPFCYVRLNKGNWPIARRLSWCFGSRCLVHVEKKSFPALWFNPEIVLPHSSGFLPGAGFRSGLPVLCISSTFFFVPMPPHVPYGLLGLPSRLWPKCNRFLRLGRPWGAITLSRWGGWWYMNIKYQEGP